MHSQGLVARRRVCVPKCSSAQCSVLPWLPSSSCQHARTTSTWLPLQARLSPPPSPLTLQLHCLPVSLRFMLTHDLCLPMAFPLYFCVSVQFLLLPSAQVSPPPGALPDFPLAWVKVLSRPHSANNHDMTLQVVSTLVCELSAGWFVVFTSVSSRPGRTQGAG